MSIEFHCEHCNKVIQAPPEAAGRRGKCPHCGNVNYIPSPRDTIEEYDLSPVDVESEQRRAREEAEAHEIQRRLLHERKEIAGPDEAPRIREEDEAVRPGDLKALLMDYLSAMGRGQLEEADRVAAAMSRNKKESLALIDRVGADDVTAAAMSTLPRPVMLGFLRQLRGKL